MVDSARLESITREIELLVLALAKEKDPQSASVVKTRIGVLRDKYTELANTAPTAQSYQQAVLSSVFVSTDYIGYSCNGSSESVILDRTAILEWMGGVGDVANARRLLSSSARFKGEITHFAVFSAAKLGVQKTDWQQLSNKKRVWPGDTLSWGVGTLRVWVEDRPSSFTEGPYQYTAPKHQTAVRKYTQDQIRKVQQVFRLTQFYGKPNLTSRRPKQIPHPHLAHLRDELLQLAQRIRDTEDARMRAALLQAQWTVLVEMRKLGETRDIEELLPLYEARTLMTWKSDVAYREKRDAEMALFLNQMPITKPSNEFIFLRDENGRTVARPESPKPDPEEERKRQGGLAYSVYHHPWLPGWRAEIDLATGGQWLFWRPTRQWADRTGKSFLRRQVEKAQRIWESKNPQRKTALQLRIIEPTQAEEHAKDTAEWQSEFDKINGGPSDH